MFMPLLLLHSNNVMIFSRPYSVRWRLGLCYVVVVCDVAYCGYGAF